LRRWLGLTLDLQSVPAPLIYPVVDHPDGPAVLRCVGDVEGKELKERLGVLVVMTDGIPLQSKLKVHQNLHGTFRIQGDLPAGKGRIPDELKTKQDKHQRPARQEQGPAWSRRPEATKAEAADGLRRAALLGLAPHLLE
jgi:hypothetical protein